MSELRRGTTLPGLRAFSSCAALAAALLIGQPTYAQYTSGFETLTASPEGVVLTGQDGFYIPDGTDSVDALAYTYADNVLGIPANPAGGEQFVAGVGPGSPTFSRAQRDIGWGSGVWRARYDALAQYPGDPPGGNNLGSFSVQPYPGSASYIHLFSWVDLNDPTVWQAFYLAYDAAGAPHAQPGMSPGPAWESLELDRWYYFETLIDFDANRIIEVSIIDDEGVGATFAPTDWYLEGGDQGGSPTPTGFRFFAGGSVPGNGVAWDNLFVSCLIDLDGDGDIGFSDLLLLLNAWGPQDDCPPYHPADLDRDCDVGFSDLLLLLSAWGPCP